MTADSVLVRNSAEPDGPVVRFSLDEWSSFRAALAAGEFATGTP